MQTQDHPSFSSFYSHFTHNGPPHCFSHGNGAQDGSFLLPIGFSPVTVQCTPPSPHAQKANEFACSVQKGTTQCPFSHHKQIQSPLVHLCFIFIYFLVCCVTCRTPFIFWGILCQKEGREGAVGPNIILPQRGETMLYPTSGEGVLLFCFERSACMMHV